MCAATTVLLTAAAALRLRWVEPESSFKFRDISREPSTAITPIPIKQINSTAAAMKVLVRIVRREKNRDAGALANVRMMLLCPEAPSPRALLPVHSNADEIITHPFDVAGL